MKLIECVPNFSEGRDAAAIGAIRDAIAAVPGVSVLHVTSDPWHNRSVITFVAPAETMTEAAVTAIRAARDRIDLTRHAGVHPRMGAADVVPFIPLDGATMTDCVAIAHETGRRVGEELGIPVYLYEQAATRPTRRNLADIRRGGFEALRGSIATDPARTPDFGPLDVHPTAGAVAIGARQFLIAFNIYLGDSTRNLPIARAIARLIRESSGGLTGVKALGLDVNGEAQVSMNIVDIERAPLLEVYSAVEGEARAHGAEITWSEIVGLVPERAVFDVTSRALKLRDDAGAHVLERILLGSRAGQSLHGYIESVGAASAIPGGGSVAAIVAALAAALARMVAGLTLGRARYASSEDAMREVDSRARELCESLQALAQLDADAYTSVMDARKLKSAPSSTPDHRDTIIQVALLAAARVPLEVCRASVEAARLSEIVAEHGNANAITDAGVAAALASAACVSAAYNVRINVRSLPEPSAGSPLAAQAVAFSLDAAQIAARVAQRVEAAL